MESIWDGCGCLVGEDEDADIRASRIIMQDRKELRRISGYADIIQLRQCAMKVHELGN